MKLHAILALVVFGSQMQEITMKAHAEPNVRSVVKQILLVTLRKKFHQQSARTEKSVWMSANIGVRSSELVLHIV